MEIIKKILVISLLLVVTTIAAWSFRDILLGKESPLESTQIQFSQTQIDMGQLQQGKPQTAIFSFINTGKHPLIIQQVEAGCGCTEPEWPKRPIKPAQVGKIKVTYDAKYPGRFLKSLKVFCNSDKGIEELLVKGEVDVEKLLK